MHGSTILDRLQHMRRKVRVRLVTYGVCAVAAGGVMSFLTIVILDWLLWLPALLRMVVTGFFLAGFAGASWYWVVRPLQATLSLEELAARIERHFGGLGDRISSAVSFLRAGPHESPTLIERALRDAEHVAADVRLEEALTVKPLLVSGAWCAAMMVLLSGIIVAEGLNQWAGTGLYRYLYPFGDIEWPRSVEIMPLTGTMNVPLGESVTLKMRVRRGLDDELRGVVHLREPSGELVALTMKREGRDTFFATVDSITEDLTYWYEAGDDSTARHPYTLHVVRRPEVVEVVATVHPPDYARERQPQIIDARSGPIRGTVGGRVQLDVLATKPLPASGEVASAALVFDDGAVQPLQVDAERPDRAAGTIDITGDRTFRIELRDAAGFASAGSTTYTLLATADQPPNVTITEPRSAVELTPVGSLRVVVDVQDDFGVAEASLRVERPATGETQLIPLLRAEQAGPDQSGDAGPMSLTYDWQLASLGLTPGEVVLYSAEALDNCRTESMVGQLGRSATMQIRIISDAEFETRLRDDLSRLEARLRQVLLEQMDVFDRTVAVTPSGDEPLSDVQRDAVSGLSSRQARLGTRLEELSQRFAELADRARRNRGGALEDTQRLAEAGGEVRNIAEGPAREAARDLTAAHEGAAATEQAAALNQAAEQQRQALDRMRTLMRTLSRWGDFQALVSRTRDLLDRQRQLRTATEETGRATVGKTPDQLSDEESAELAKVRRQQEQLTNDFEQLMQKMQQTAESAAQKDPMTAAAAESGLRTARAHEIERHLAEALKAIGSNRTAAASMEQRQVEEGLRDMARNLREQEARELAQLRKNVAEAQEQIAEILEQQKALRAATHEAEQVGAAAEVAADYAGHQRTIRTNTRHLGDELAEGNPAGASVADIVRQAAGPMQTAEEALLQVTLPAAVEAQDEAIRLLEQALADLQRMDEELAEAEARRSLAEVREQLETLRTTEAAVQADYNELRATIDPEQMLRREQTRVIARLARQQAEAVTGATALRQELSEVPAFAWSMDRVLRWMDAVRGMFESRRLEPELDRSLSDTLRELDRLIAAIRDTESMPLPTEFVESDSGDQGGQGGPSSKKRPVPTLSELLLLKSMQAEINERTRQLGVDYDPEVATEAQLQEIKRLGEDQAEISRLTETVTSRLRGGG